MTFLQWSHQRNKESIAAWDEIEKMRAQRDHGSMDLADWKRKDISSSEDYAAKIAGNTSIYSNNLSMSDLLKYQQNQGMTNYCGSYAISTGLNMLYGTHTTGNDVRLSFVERVNWFEDPRYSLLPDGAAVVPWQQANVVNKFSSIILGRNVGLPTAEARELTPEEMRAVIINPNQAALFTYNTEAGNVLSGHVVTLAAYDANTREFGFLNSGAQRSPNGLTWKTEAEIQAYLQDPIGLSKVLGVNDPHFTVISK